MKRTEKEIQGAFLITLDIMEQVYSVPVEQRMSLLLKLTKEKKAKFLGTTDKTAPELATEFIKKGVKAQSFVAGRNNKTLDK